MAWNTSGPAHLGADNVIRFLDADHFLRELQGNLGRGRAFVRSKRKFELKASLALKIEAPGVAWSVSVAAVVVFVRDGFVGLEFEDFERAVLPKLDMLGEEAARAVEASAAQSERTVIAPTPMPFRTQEDRLDEDRDSASDTGDLASTQDHASTSDDSVHEEDDSEATGDQNARLRPSYAEEDERTGEMYIPPELQKELFRPADEPPEEETSEQEGVRDEDLADVAQLRRELSGDLAEMEDQHRNADDARDAARRKKNGRDALIEEEVFSTGDYGEPVRPVDPVDPDEEMEQTNAELSYESELLASKLAEAKKRDTKGRVTTAPTGAREAPTPLPTPAPMPAHAPAPVAAPAPQRSPPTRTPQRDAKRLRARRSPSGSRLDHIEAATMRLEKRRDVPEPRAETPPDRADTPLAGEEEARSIEEISKPMTPAAPIAAPSAAAPAPPATPSPSVVTASAPPPSAAPAPAVSAPPPQASTTPSLISVGADALADKRLHIPRATASGVLRANDAGTLLGLYLAEMRHGHITMLGGPEGGPGDPVKLKVAAGFVITLDCTIIARVGEWLTLRIVDATPIKKALADIEDAWKESITELTGKIDEDREEDEEDEEEDVESENTGDTGELPEDAILEVPSIPQAATTLAAAPSAPAVESAKEKSAPDLLDFDAMMRVAMPGREDREGRDDRDDDDDRDDRPAPPAKSAPAPEPEPEEEMGPDLPAPKSAKKTEAPKAAVTTGALPKLQTPAADPAPPSAAPAAAAPQLAPPAPAAPPPKLATLPPGALSAAAVQAAISDEGPPQIPKLAGDLVTFLRVKDLKHELDTNLKNGGLFVESGAIALRTHKSLRVAIGAWVTGVKLEADVVFAAGGRVGFSVGGAAEAKAALEKAIEAHAREAIAAPPAAAPAATSIPPATTASATAPATPAQSPPSTMDLVPQILADAKAQAQIIGESSGIPPFSGRITKPPSFSELLDFQTKRPKSANELAASAVVWIFDLICRNNGRGVLSLRSGDHRAVIYFHEGSVAFVESAPFEEESSLGRILISTKKITETALREGLDRAKQQKKPLGRVLVSLGTVTKKILSEALRDQARMKIEAMFSYKEGTHEWTLWREPPGDADLVLTKGVGIVARYVKNRYETMGIPDLEAMFGKNMGRIVVLKEGADTIGTNIGLQQKELRFLEVSLLGERTISDAVMGSPLGRLGSLRLIAVALSMGMVQFRDGRIGTNVGPVRSKSETESPEVARLKRELKERLGLLKGMNHFEVLGVHWSAHYRSYRAPYEKAKRELDVARGQLRDAPADVQQLAQEIMRITEKAYTTLHDEKQRVAYRNQFFDKTERQYSADMLVKQGEVALMRGDRVGAIEALETAVELDPSARNRSLLANAREGKS